MTNWHSPSVALAEYYAYVKLIHFLAGLYIWEMLVNINFDYSILTRIFQKRAHHGSLLLYLCARWIPLITIILEMAGQDTHFWNCQAYITLIYLFSYLGFLCAAALFLLRIVAVWERNKIVTTLATATWLANLGACLHCAATARSIWIESLQICGMLNVPRTKFGLLFIINTEFVLLILMLAGLLRWKSRGKGGLWHLLFTQGVVWFAVTVVADIPPLVFVFLNLNDDMDAVTQVPAPFIVSIAATRMYRGLSDYLVHADIFHSVHAAPAEQLNSIPFGNFTTRPGVGNITDSEGMQSNGQQTVGGSLTSITFASSSDATKKAASGGDETV